MSKMGEAMQEGMEATAESARNLGYMELCVELIERASKLLARPVTP